MSDAETKSERGKSADLHVFRSAQPTARNLPKVRIRIIPLLITLATTALAAVLGWAMWDAYMGAPWTRDGTVRVYVVKMAPEVVGRIVELPVADNQFVHKGDLLIVIDPTDYVIAIRQGEAAVQQAKADWQNKQTEFDRRQKLNDLAVTLEEQQTYASSAMSAQAGLPAGTGKSGSRTGESASAQKFVPRSMAT